VDAGRDVRVGQHPPGKLRKHEIIVEATNVAMAGMDPMEFLTTESPVVMLCMQAIAANVAEIRAKQNGN
jgi:hypothetical protein